MQFVKHSGNLQRIHEICNKFQHMHVCIWDKRLAVSIIWKNSDHNTNEGKRNYGEKKHFLTNSFLILTAHDSHFFVFTYMSIHIIAWLPFPLFRVQHFNVELCSFNFFSDEIAVDKLQVNFSALAHFPVRVFFNRRCWFFSVSFLFLLLLFDFT